MATLTVRNVPDDAKHRFRQVAAAHGRSMEEHLRQLVVEAGQDESLTTQGFRDVTQSFRHFTPAVDPEAARRAESRARIERLIELGRGLEDFELPPREVGTIKDVDFS